MISGVECRAVQSVSQSESIGSAEDQARQEYDALYQTFLNDTQGPHPDWNKVLQDVQKLLGFLQDDKKVALLQKFANEHGTPPYAEAVFANDVKATKNALEYVKNEITAGKTPQLSGAFEFTNDIFRWTRYVLII